MTSHDEAMRAEFKAWARKEGYAGDAWADPNLDAMRVGWMACSARAQAATYEDGLNKGWNDGYHKGLVDNAQAASGEPVAWRVDRDNDNDLWGPFPNFNLCKQWAETFKRDHPGSRITPLYEKTSAPSVSVEALEGLCEEWDRHSGLGGFKCLTDLLALIAASKKV